MQEQCSSEPPHSIEDCSDSLLLQFGVFTVDVEARELRKRDTRVKLQRRPLQLLLALLERPGEMVTREDLRRRFWRDRSYADFDHSISSALHRVRTVLNDSATHPRYIETVGAVGYRFIYPVRSTIRATRS